MRQSPISGEDSANSAHKVTVMLKRTVTAILLIALLCGVLAASYFVDRAFIDIFIWILLAIALREMYFCLQSAGYRVMRVPLTVYMLTAYPVTYVMHEFVGGYAGYAGIGICFAASALYALIQFTLSDPERMQIKDLFATLFVLIYPAFFISLAWMLTAKYVAVYAVLFAVFLPVGADTFAYWFGSMIGGRKLCPTISPKKTVAGFVGGIIGGMVVAAVFYLVFEYAAALPAAPADGLVYVPFTDSVWKSVLIYMAIGFVGALAGQLGDLAASRIKRALGVKDFGRIFPGHGGVMDRFDSIMSGITVLTVAFLAIYA